MTPDQARIVHHVEVSKGDLNKVQVKDRSAAPPTFAEALMQLQAAHRREIESMQKELKKRGWKATQPADGGAAVAAEPSASPVAPFAVASQGHEPATVPAAAGATQRFGQPRKNFCPSCGGPSDVPGARVCSSCLGPAHVSSHREAWTGRAAADRTSESQSDDTFDDPYMVPERKDSGDIVWNPFADGQSSFSKAMNRYFESGGQSRKKRRAYKIVRSRPFSVVSYAAIMANSLFIGISMQLEMDAVQSGTAMKKWPEYVELGFLVFFTIELLCKVLAEDVYVFFGGDWQWNLLDTILVLSALLQLMFEFASGADTPNLTPARNIRLFRIMRVFRITRVLKACQTLRVMIFSIFKSLDALVWVLVVLLFFKYIFAMIFMHGTITYFESNLDGSGVDLSLEEQQFWESPSDHIDYMKCGWSTIDRALLILFESITGGRDWGEVFTSLFRIGPVYGILFIAYVYFMSFLVLNVVIGTVVDVTADVASMDRDMMVDDQIASLRGYASDIKTFFKQADADHSGYLSWREFKNHLEDDRVKAYFQTLDLDIRKAHTLFKLLDRNGNGEVGIEEFLDGCLRLRGQAKSLDIHLVIYQLETLIKGISWMMPSS